MAAGDFNGDGVADLAVANQDTASVSVLLGKGETSMPALAPGYARLFQIAIQIPARLSNGDYPVVATMDGEVSAATTLITVHQP